MNGCMCGCGGGGGWGHGRGRFARWPSREERVERLEGYQRDLEQQAADVADEIRRLKNKPEPAS
jgi:hypothetical protein